jgi:hypothetical protein
MVLNVEARVTSLSWGAESHHVSLLPTHFRPFLLKYGVGFANFSINLYRLSANVGDRGWGG